MPILRLKDDVIGQIAAGEVVERPAHLIKELVENSLDAGASKIEIDFSKGGRFLTISDNGHGIEPEELPLALERHATSKISEHDDLMKLHSFGFRGEALAAMASVSQLTLISRVPNAESGYQIRSDFGKLSAVEKCSAAPGTEIKIQRLFENVPARLKFLKSDAAEVSQIKTALKALALANPGFQFRIRGGGSLLYFWPATPSRLERARQVLATQELFETNSEENNIKVHLALTSPYQVQKSSRSLFFFVQNRWVQDKSLAAALMEGHRGVLMHGEYPTAVLAVELPPDEVDVNIHPTKSQVKFLDSSRIFKQVLRATRELVAQSPWRGPDKVKPAQYSQSSPLDFEPPARRSYEPVFTADPGPAARGPAAQEPPAREPSAQGPAAQAPAAQGPIAREPEMQVFTTSPPEPEEALATNSQPRTAALAKSPPQQDLFSRDTSGAPAPPQTRWQDLRVIGQAFSTYIVTESAQAMVLIDQHAAHERVAYERLMSRYRENWGEVQRFLIPLALDLEVDEAEEMLTLVPELKKMGIEMERSGPDSFVILEAPPLLSESALIGALGQVASRMQAWKGRDSLEKLISDLAASMACHSVVRAGQTLEPEAISSLLMQMDEFPASSFCPHGRPVSVSFPLRKLERDFGRTL